MQRLNEIGEPQLRAVAASCMGFFLKGQRTYTKDMLGRLHSLAKCKEIFQDNFFVFSNRTMLWGLCQSKALGSGVDFRKCLGVGEFWVAKGSSWFGRVR